MPDVRTPRRSRQLALDATVVAVAALGVLTVVFQLWNADLSVPFVYIEPDRSPLTYAPDASFYLMIVKGAIDHGWFLNNPSLGFPFGQALHEFPQGLDNLNLLVLQVIGWITGDPFLTVNLFFLATFVGVSVSAYLVGRRLGLSRIAGMLTALLFTFLPYHFARGTAHVLLSAYWLVPVAALLLVTLVSGQPPFTVDADTDRGWRVAWRARASVLWLLACIGLASTGSYYAALTMTLVVVVVLVDFVARRNRRVLMSGVLTVSLILGMAMVNLVPTFVYWAEHGRNGDLVQRGPSETEVNGLKVSQLVLPVEGHRIGALAGIQADSTRFTVIQSERGQELGAIGAAGFLAMVLILLASPRRRRHGPDEGAGDPAASAAPSGVATAAGRDEATGEGARTPPLEVIRIFGIATVGGILVATVSGFSLLASGAGIKEIRSWNRISVFIGYFALVTVGFGVDWLRRRLPDRPGVRVLAVAVVAGLALVGILDQFAPRMVPRYAATERTFDSDAAFFARVERTLPRGSAVFTLPYVFFPESGTVDGIGPYDTTRGYLHTDGLRWSWGGVIGTDADWVAGTAQAGTDVMLERVVAMGFRGLVIDRRGSPSPLREQAISAALGQEATVSPDGTLAFYDLRDYATALRERLGPEGLRAVRREALRDHGRPRAPG